ncbi:hypothetical protein [Citricoccus nitrophenolicus]|uniref:hypothetical protein n=1 Tax=Citricoccus nitrophenolicus TaxID=863575 RepID=UPI0031E9FF70
MRTIEPGTEVLDRNGNVRPFGWHVDTIAEHQVLKVTEAEPGVMLASLWANAAYLAPADDVRLVARPKAVVAVKDVEGAEFPERCWRTEATLLDGTVESFWTYTKREGLDRGARIVAIDRWHNG